MRGRTLAGGAYRVVDGQGVRGALKEDKAVPGELLAAVEVEDGSVLALLFRTAEFME